MPLPVNNKSVQKSCPLASFYKKKLSQKSNIVLTGKNYTMYQLSYPIYYTIFSNFGAKGHFAPNQKKDECQFFLRSDSINTLYYFVFQISPPSFQFQTTCARIYDILAQYDPPGQVMAFMGVIMILINIISRKKYIKTNYSCVTSKEKHFLSYQKILQIYYLFSVWKISKKIFF